MNKLLERIFSYHEYLYSDPIFNSLKMQLLALLKNIQAKDITIQLGYGYNEDREIKKSKNVTILGTTNEEEKYNILIEIETNNDYSYGFEIFNGKVSFNGYYYDKDGLLHVETYEYEKDKTKLTKIMEVMDRNDYYVDYSIDITSYSKNNNPKKETEEENKIFSEKFGIPIEKAEFYRAHFKENSDYLNESKVRSEMEYEDNASSNENSFTTPFNISDFALVFDFDFETNEEHLYFAIEASYTIEDLEEAGRRLNFLKELLESIVGYDGEIAIEGNLYLNISAYVYNSSTKFLTTRGRIIKKINGELFMYFIEITNNKVTSFAKPLSKEEATKIYFANDQNLTTEDLREFLEVERNLS